MNDVKPTIKFRCPPELEANLPHPIPAVQGLPDWFKSMPVKAFSELSQAELQTVKKCPPFIDAMTCGFLIPLAIDVHVENGEFSWNWDIPPGAMAGAPHSPLAFHDNSQVTGSPFFEDDRVVIKFNTFWTIELPPGYSLLISHPFNRADLPFVTLTGLVDADRYHHFLNFPARWRDSKFSGVLAKGTPVAQCVPIKREDWAISCEALDNDEIDRLQAMQTEFAAEEDIYRRQFRAPKR